MRHRTSGHHIRRGAAALELAIVLPLLILLALGCADFGRFAYYSTAVQNAARAGAESAIMDPYQSGGLSAWTTAITKAATDEMTNQTGYKSNALSVTTPIPVTIETSGLRRIQVTVTYTGFTTAINWNMAGYGIPHNPTIAATIVMRAIR